MNVTPLRQPDEPELPSGPESESAATTSAKQPRGRSTIEFPYADLEDSIAVARMILDKGGVPLDRDQLAAAMGHPASSGAFLAKIHASRMFGFVEIAHGKSKLTDLGFAVVDRDEERAKAARVKAFLNVPLFSRAYGEFRNRQLPPRNKGLEKALVGFGVLETRKHNARWAFDRSARQAGFFENGDDRLVSPVVMGTLPAEGQDAQIPPQATAETVETPMIKTATSPADQLLVRGLLERLPAVNTSWSLNDRARWLRALAVNLAMLYGEKDEADIEIKVPSRAAAVNVKVAQSSAPNPPPKPSAASEFGIITKDDLDDEIPF